MIHSRHCLVQARWRLSIDYQVIKDTLIATRIKNADGMFPSWSDNGRKLGVFQWTIFTRPQSLRGEIRKSEQTIDQYVNILGRRLRQQVVQLLRVLFINRVA